MSDAAGLRSLGCVALAARREAIGLFVSRGIGSATARLALVAVLVLAPFASPVHAATPASSDDLLDPEVAFKASAMLVGRDRIEIRYDTAPGYYLYRDRLTFAVEPTGARLGRPKLPKGKVKNDEFFGRQVIYRNRAVVTIPVQWNGTGPLTLTADLQGCADLGVCYPPVRRTFTLSP